MQRDVFQWGSKWYNRDWNWKILVFRSWRLFWGRDDHHRQETPRAVLDKQMCTKCFLLFASTFDRTELFFSTAAKSKLDNFVACKTKFSFHTLVNPIIPYETHRFGKTRSLHHRWVNGNKFCRRFLSRRRGERTIITPWWNNETESFTRNVWPVDHKTAFKTPWLSSSPYPIEEDVRPQKPMDPFPFIVFIGSVPLMSYRVKSFLLQKN